MMVPSGYVTAGLCVPSASPASLRLFLPEGALSELVELESLARVRACSGVREIRLSR
jgi:hypothetical protein